MPMATAPCAIYRAGSMRTVFRIQEVRLYGCQEEQGIAYHLKSQASHLKPKKPKPNNYVRLWFFVPGLWGNYNNFYRSTIMNSDRRFLA